MIRRCRHSRFALQVVFIFLYSLGSHAEQGGGVGSFFSRVLNTLGLSSVAERLGLQTEDELALASETTQKPSEIDIPIVDTMEDQGRVKPRDLVREAKEAHERADKTLEFLKGTIGTAPDNGKVTKLVKEALVKSQTATEAAESWTTFTDHVRDETLPQFFGQVRSTRKVMGEDHHALVTDVVKSPKQALANGAPSLS
mmetsp:Transcript_54335/g.129477  ORF Transcript_54335/g.129477 Transcript_54335/m.129477 type:complete len:198 (+) Transcript_54335:103-696(+)